MFDNENKRILVDIPLTTPTENKPFLNDDFSSTKNAFIVAQFIIAPLFLV